MNPFTILGAKIFAGLFAGAALVATVQTVRIEGIGCDYPEEGKPECWWTGYKADNAVIRIDLEAMTVKRDTEVEKHRATKQNYIDAQAQAATNQENMRRRVIAQQQEITREVESNYRQRLAANDAHYRRLLDRERTRGANLASAAGDLQLPGDGGTASGADVAARHQRLSAKYRNRRVITPQEDCAPGRVCLSFEEARIASDQAEQLDAWIDWAEDQKRVRASD